MLAPAHTARADVTAQRAFRDALGCYATGVAVVTGLSPEGRPFGLTINSFSSLSMAPRLILWSLRSQSPLAACFSGGTVFAVNVLGAAQGAVARQFATPREDRFSDIDWRLSARGTPHLDGAVAVFDCRLSALQSIGDHELLIGLVEDFSTAPGEPLLFVRGNFRALGAD